MKKYKLLIALIISVMVLSGCGELLSMPASGETPSGEKKYVLRLAHSQPTAAVLNQNMEWLNKELEKRSNGRLSLEIYPNSQLMPGETEMHALLQGQVDMVQSYSSITGGFDPIWYFFDLPFLFDYDPQDPSSYIKTRRDFLQSEEGGGKIAKMMEEKHLKLLSVNSADTYATFWTSDEQNKITDPASAKGLKIRTAGGPIAGQTLQAIQASGISIAGSELPTALQQGIVDGMITVPLYVYQNKLPVKTQTLYPLVNYVMPLFISQKKFDSLPADLQEILVETSKDLDVYSDKMVDEKMENMVETLKTEMGIETVFPSEQEIEKWKNVTKPIWGNYEKMEPRAAELLKEAERINSLK